MSKVLLACGNTHVPFHVILYKYTCIQPNNAIRLQLLPCTTFLNPPVILTIATPSSLLWFRHWLVDCHGYTNAAKNLNELDVIVSANAHTYT